MKYWLKSNYAPVILAVILTASFFLMFFSSKTDSLTVDELVHISAGYLHTWKGEYLFNPEHPPLPNDLAGLSARLANPNVPDASKYSDPYDQWLYGNDFFYQANNNIEQILLYARLPFILMTLGLIYLVYLWGKALFGVKGGLWGALMVGFSPNILAHGHLATTDMALVFFYVLTAWLSRKYLFKPTLESAVLLGLGLGLLLLSKFSGILFVAVIILIFIYQLSFQRLKTKLVLGNLAAVFGIALFLVWGVYAFSMRGDITKTDAPVRLSSLGNVSVLISSPAEKWILMPFDKFLLGYSMVSSHNEIGHWSYLNGKVDYHGWWQYFPEVLMLKLTLFELVIFLSAIVLLIDHRKPLREELILVFPAVLFFAISLTSKIDIGVRHVLVLIPFMMIFAARVTLNKSVWAKAALAVVVLGQIAVSLLYFPQYISYFNILAGGPEGGIRYLVDSNLDWNQSMIRFSEYAKENGINEVYALCWDYSAFNYYKIRADYPPAEPFFDRPVVICAQQLKVNLDKKFDWITAQEPDDIVGDSMYVWRFDLR